MKEYEFTYWEIRGDILRRDIPLLPGLFVGLLLLGLLLGLLPVGLLFGLLLVGLLLGLLLVGLLLVGLLLLGLLLGLHLGLAAFALSPERVQWRALRGDV